LPNGSVLSLVDGVPTLTDALTVEGVLTSAGAINSLGQRFSGRSTHSLSGTTSLTYDGKFAMDVVSAAATPAVSMIVGLAAGDFGYLYNSTTTAFSILHNSGAFSVSRFYCPNDTDLAIAPNAGVLWWYDDTVDRIRVVTLPSPAITTAEMNTAKIPRTLFSANGTQQNSSFTATNVFDKTIPANTFDTNGQSIHWVASGSWTANANTKQVDPQFDGISLVALGPAVINTAGARWWFDAHIHRANSTNMHCVLHFVTHNAAGVIVTNSVLTTDNTMDWTAAIDLDLFLDGDATGDIFVNYSKVVFYPEGA
jgi:hypothetical protein